uniref:BZIP domain-containing protein n=1 Tax=Gouania willdenowi TaxID=441366 RepID=A0A8C5HUK0_GOUWI
MVPQDIVQKGPLYDFLVGPDLLEMLAPEVEPSTISGAHQTVIAQLMAPEAENSLVDGSSSLVYPGSVAALPASEQDETYKKKLSLLRNKKAVHLYREKKKQSVKNLTDHVAMLEKLNSKLKQELKTLKEIYHKTPVC